MIVARRRAFTLIETMLAVLLLALLAGAAALTFSKPVAKARGEDAVEMLRHFDSTTRTAATSAGRTMRITFDMADNRIIRREPAAAASDDVQFAATLPAGCRVAAVRIGGDVRSVGAAAVDVSPMGLSRTYAVHVVGDAVDQWLVFAGLSGEMVKVADERSLVDIVGATPR
jgi:prepilin-type N-terminal cleavage/methylation domain-containing protein